MFRVLRAEGYGRSGSGWRQELVRVCRWVWMVVRFVCVIRVSACALVCPVCPGSPRCLFTGTAGLPTPVCYEGF